MLYYCTTLLKFALCMENEKIRHVFIYKEYFTNFYAKQRRKVQEKTPWTFKMIETIQHVPAEYLKHIEGTDGLYEIRVQNGNAFLGFSVFLIKEC